MQESSKFSNEEINAKIPQQDDYFEFYHKPEENTFGFNSNLQDSKNSIPSKFSYIGPDEKYTNIQLNLNNDRQAYKIVVENVSRKTKIEETTILNDEFDIVEEIVV